MDKSDKLELEASNIPDFKFCLTESSKQDKQFLPLRAEAKASGWDVRCAQNLELIPGKYYKIPLGIKTFSPDGWWLELKPRSSTFGKKFIHCLYGTIDESYEGELIFACTYLPSEFLQLHYINNCPSQNYDTLKLSFGEAIGQIIPVKRQEMTVTEVVEEEFKALCSKRNASRGTGGFGSTDKK